MSIMSFITRSPGEPADTVIQPTARSTPNVPMTDLGPDSTGVARQTTDPNNIKYRHSLRRIDLCIRIDKIGTNLSRIHIDPSERKQETKDPVNRDDHFTLKTTRTCLSVQN